MVSLSGYNSTMVEHSSYIQAKDDMLAIISMVTGRENRQLEGSVYIDRRKTSHQAGCVDVRLRQRF
jgi:hypothetical protein